MWKYVLAPLLWLTACGGLVAAEPDQATIQAWVADLGAERYSKRDNATRHLIDAGQAAIEPLMQGIAQQGLEVTTRGIYVLQQLAVAGDLATEDRARESLERIAATRVTAAARNARDALDKLDALRQQRALAELERLGAVVDRQHQEMPSLFGPLFAIEINDRWRGTTEDLRWLRFLKDVQQVSLMGPQVTDAWLAHIEAMRSVMLIKIKRASLTDAGLAPLGKLEQLQYLRLLYVPIGDDAVDQLVHCKRLMRIDLYGSQVTRDGEAKLRDAVAARIDRRKGAFLGISPSAPDNVMWEINHVTAGSAADRSGLRPGDALVTYDGNPVGDFNSLTALIAEQDVGLTVTVSIRRDGQVIERQITLGEWD